MRLLAILTLAICAGCARPDDPADGPLVDIETPIEFLAELHAAGAKGESWTKSAVEVALRLQGVSPLTDTDERYTISIDYYPGKGRVVVHERGMPDDSFYEMYSVIELSRDEKGGYWIPRQRKGCWKGRGLSGWSTTTPH